MVLKNKSNSSYFLLILVLISLLLLMLYLGNYNLIEGNGNVTPTELTAKLDDLLQSNNTIVDGLKSNRTFKSGCSSVEELNKNHTESSIKEGGAQAFGADTKQLAAQTTATLCSQNSK